MSTTSELSGAVIEAAIEVHRHFGPGLLENVYEEALVHELSARGIDLERQLQVPVPPEDSIRCQRNAVRRLKIEPAREGE